MKKLIGWFFKRSNRFVFAGVLFLSGVIAWGGFNTFMEHTNSLEFCISCHEMRDNVFVEYQKTVHYSNRTGVRTVCSDCHVPKEWVPKVIRKVKATNELYHWALGTIETPEKFNAHRFTMAKRVWAEMKANDSHECRNCHDYDAMHWEKQASKRGKDAMQVAQKEGLSCIECHKGIAHGLPNMTKEYEALTADLQAAASRQKIAGGKASAFTEKTVFMEQDEASDTAVTLEPMAEIEVLEVSGDWAKVRFTGWDREGGTQLFAKPGPQMQLAKLGAGGMDATTQISETVDTNTELTWHEISIEGWTKTEGLIADRNRLDAYADDLWRTDCNLCHNLFDKAAWNARDWEKKIKAMRRFTYLEPEQLRLVLRTIQAGSEDMVAK